MARTNNSVVSQDENLLPVVLLYIIVGVIAFAHWLAKSASPTTATGRTKPVTTCVRQMSSSRGSQY